MAQRADDIRGCQCIQRLQGLRDELLKTEAAKTQLERDWAEEAAEGEKQRRTGGTTVRGQSKGGQTLSAEEEADIEVGETYLDAGKRSSYKGYGTRLVVLLCSGKGGSGCGCVGGRPHWRKSCGRGADERNGGPD